MNQIASMLSDGAGNVSTLRVILFLFVIYILSLHLILAFHTGAAVPFTGDEMTVLGILCGSKLVQNQQENSQPSTPNSQPPKA